MYLGAQEANGVVQPDSARHACVTPCLAELRPSDVNAGGGIHVELRKPGYYPLFTGLSDGVKKLDAGGTCELALRPIRLRPLE